MKTIYIVCEPGDEGNEPIAVFDNLERAKELINSLDMPLIVMKLPLNEIPGKIIYHVSFYSSGELQFVKRELAGQNFEEHAYYTGFYHVFVEASSKDEAIEKARKIIENGKVVIL